MGLQYTDGYQIYPDDYRGPGDPRDIFQRKEKLPHGLVVTPPFFRTRDRQACTLLVLEDKEGAYICLDDTPLPS